MFVKKDLRKVPEILQDDNDKREEMLLGRRGPEFNGNLNILCKPQNVPQLSNLNHLSLYGNELESVSGIGILCTVPIARLNLGNNHLTEIPAELGTLTTLKELLVDDNRLSALPPSLFELTKLEELRISGNCIKEIPEALSIKLCQLHHFACDRNQLKYLPKNFGKGLKKLKRLSLQGNKLSELSSCWSDMADSLTSLNVSSNQLKELPSSVATLLKLETLKASSNLLTTLPVEFSMLPVKSGGKLKLANLNNNLLDDQIPETLIETWGIKVQIKALHEKKQFDNKINKNVVITTLFGNPIALTMEEKKQKKTKSKTNKGLEMTVCDVEVESGKSAGVDENTRLQKKARLE
eukprot:g3817.t1